MATTSQIEQFMLDNFKIMPLGTSDKYLVEYVFEEQSDGKVFLKHDTEYVNNATLAPTRSNFAILDADNAWLDNGSVDRVFLYDVTYLFNEGFMDSHGCSLSGSLDNSGHSVTFLMTQDDSDVQEWTIADNGRINTDYTVYRTSFSPNDYVSQTPSTGSKGVTFTSLGSAQNYVLNEFVSNDYPTSQNSTFASTYYNSLVAYIECLKSKQCCLKSCW